MWPENFIIMLSIQEEAADAKRTDVCSEATLCANDIGFFAEVADKLLDAAKENDWLQKVFSNIDGDAEKIEAVMQNQNVSTALKLIMSRLEPNFRTKHAKISQTRRNEAQGAITEGNLKKALALCSQAIIRAPLPDDNETFEEGLTLAYALWQRSEVLLKMNKFELAIQDLKLSLSYRLPAKTRGNYYRRLGHCYKGLNDFARAKVAYELGQLLTRDEEEKNNIAAELKSLEGMEEVPQPKNSERTFKQVKPTGGVKENLPALSRLVKIAESEAMGKYAVAASRIHTGDVLLVEQPYAACLLPGFYGTHCHHCFKRLEAPMACPTCSGVAFCSNNCRDIAVSTYHGFECSFQGIFLGSGMSILSQIALRMITQAGLDLSLAIHVKYFSQEMSVINNVMMSNIDGVSTGTKFRRSRKERNSRDARNSLEKLLTTNSEARATTSEEKEKSPDIFDKATLLESIEERAGQIYSLVTHSNLRKPDDYFRRLVMSIFLKECLKKLNFFKMDDIEKLKKDELAITELLLRNLQLLQFNAHAIYETICGNHRFSGSKLIYTAVGIYPTGALFNHECYPAVARYFDGKNIVLRASRPLSTGGIVSENYGPHFFNNNTTERQKDLMCRYWFKCQCVACIENWPVLKNNQVAYTPLLRCPNNACRNKIMGMPKSNPNNCLKCGEPISEDEFVYKLDVVKDCVKQYQIGAQLMQDEKVDKAMDTLCSAVDTFCSVALPPYKDTQVAQEALRTCFANNGSVYQIFDGDN